MTKPLNGEKTHPLKPASFAVLRALAKAPQPRQMINPGVANRLEREKLVESVDLPSPFASHKGRVISHLKASATGLALLADDPEDGPRYSDELDADEEAEILSTQQ